ncbi:MAG: hypothetical protein ACFFDI_00040, partial [Promethearchaeota archaeon]
YVKDAVGNWNTSYFEFFADNTPPSISLNSPVNGTTHQSGTTIDLTITGSDGTLIYHWDTDSNSTVSATFDPILPSGDGLHRLYVYVKDSAGNWAIKIFVFSTDDTGPIITLKSFNNESVHLPGTVIDLNITDVNGISQVLYNWDGNTNISLSTPYNVFLPTEAGQHVLRVYTNDSLGNWAVKTYVFTTKEDTRTTTSTISPTSSTTTPTATVPTDFFTVEIFLLAFISLIVVFWRRKRHMVD